MVDFAELRKVINDSGMSITFIADKMGIERSNLYTRLNETVEFRVSEIENITKVLRLTDKQRDKIFFAKKRESDSTS